LTFYQGKIAYKLIFTPYMDTGEQLSDILTNEGPTLFFIRLMQAGHSRYLCLSLRGTVEKGNLVVNL
jgi:hypothetical protein